MKKINKENILIRKVNISDFGQIFSLWKKAGLNISNLEKEFSDMQITVKMNPTSCLVLVRDKTIIGAALGAFNGRRGWVYHLAIHPDFQQEGYGSLLLQKVEEELRRKGAHRVHLGVAFTNLKVLPFYEKCGYSVVNDALWLGKNI